MNELIKELVEHKQVDACYIPRYDMWQMDTESLEKFAELIVRECVGVVQGGRFLHDEAPTAIFAKECSAAINRHFGVKE